jgi:hypothetical protein
MLGDMWDGAKTSLHAEGVELTRPALGGGGTDFLKIPALNLATDITGFHSENLRLGFSGGYENLSLQPLPPQMEPTLPTSVKLDVTLDRVPWKTLASQSTIVTLLDPEKLKGIFSSAGTTITIGPSHIGNATYSSSAKGQFKASQASPYGLTGKVTSEIIGLDVLIQKLQASIATADPKTADQLRSTVANLSVLMLAGQQKSGTNSRTYLIELTPQGQTLINGVDLNLIMQGGKMITPR